ncbi:hypothetical protein BJ508DRAFT_315367 [Ascobolus immersus RN42]|uniref:Uncharacterized protein n=1 Tax=Ascobolus immersus RN42 TaxID=1160509 RepID=A0A3N4HB59_ASCIM|nr:hypothetical protein BJ508DRAFT_315367 [Ascobolus immersus RN42]
MPPKSKASLQAQQAANAEMQRIAAEQSSPPTPYAAPEEEDPAGSQILPSSQTTALAPPSTISAPTSPQVVEPTPPTEPSTAVRAASFTLTFAELQQLLAANRPPLGSGQASATPADAITLELGEVTPFAPMARLSHDPKGGPLSITPIASNSSATGASTLRTSTSSSALRTLSLIDVGLEALLSATEWEDGNIKLSNKLLGQATIKHVSTRAPGGFTVGSAPPLSGYGSG